MVWLKSMVKSRPWEGGWAVSEVDRKPGPSYLPRRVIPSTLRRASERKSGPGPMRWCAPRSLANETGIREDMGMTLAGLLQLHHVCSAEAMSCSHECSLQYAIHSRVALLVGISCQYPIIRSGSKLHQAVLRWRQRPLHHVERTSECSFPFQGSTTFRESNEPTPHGRLGQRGSHEIGVSSACGGSEQSRRTVVTTRAVLLH